MLCAENRESRAVTLQRGEDEVGEEVVLRVDIGREDIDGNERRLRDKDDVFEEGTGDL